MDIPCRSQPILPSLSYPVFMIVPSLTEEPDTTTTMSSIPEEGFEVSQFHSQDELGRVVFGFHGPDQSRMEARSLDGSVRGSYSYIDPYGHIVKMQYWDDGTGFHIAGNALPGDGRPAYTPEVEAAREQHLKIYKQTLAATQHLLQQSGDNSYADNPEQGPAPGINHFEDASQFHKGHHDNSLLVDDKESISLENPELLGNHDIFQEDEKKEDKEPEKEEVEGEVDLGEDVVPDEDLEEEGYENDQPETGNDKFVEEENDRTKEISGSYNHDQIIIRLKHLMGYNQNKENEQQDVSEVEKESIEGMNSHREDGYIHNHKMEEDDGDKDEGDDHEKEENHEVDNSRQYSAEDESNEKYKEDDSEGNDSLEYPGEYLGVIRNESSENSEEDNLGSDDIYDPETSENRNNGLKLVIQPLVQPEAESITVKPYEYLQNSRDQIAEKSDTKTDVDKPSVKRRGFFYHFQHTIPRPTERIEEAVERGLKSADGIKVPPAAIHDPQIAPYPFFN